MIATLKAFDSVKIGPEIEMPDMGYLLTIPFFDMAPYDYVMERGSRFQKSLLQRAPLTRSKKNILVTCRVNLIYPGFSPTSNRCGNTFEWHVDGSGGMDDRFSADRDIFHVISSECESRTGFLDCNLDVDTKDFDNVFEFNNALNDNLPLSVMQIPANRFCTFTNLHAHKAMPSSQPEFRFFMNITESDRMEPLPEQKRRTFLSHLYKGDFMYPNIQQTTEGIVIYEPKEELGDEVPRKWISKAGQ